MPFKKNISLLVPLFIFINSAGLFATNSPGAPQNCTQVGGKIGTGCACTAATDCLTGSCSAPETPCTAYDTPAGCNANLLICSGLNTGEACTYDMECKLGTGCGGIGGSRVCGGLGAFCRGNSDCNSPINCGGNKICGGQGAVCSDSNNTPVPSSCVSDYCTRGGSLSGTLCDTNPDTSRILFSSPGQPAAGLSIPDTAAPAPFEYTPLHKLKHLAQSLEPGTPQSVQLGSADSRCNSTCDMTKCLPKGPGNPDGVIGNGWILGGPNNPSDTADLLSVADQQSKCGLGGATVTPAQGENCDLGPNVLEIASTQTEIYNICGEECCGCYAEHGPIPEVLAQVQFCNDNFGYNAPNLFGPDGNTRTKYCLKNENGVYTNPACYNYCSYYGAGASSDSPGGIMPDTNCLAASLPLAAVGAKRGGQGTVFFPAPSDQCNSCVYSSSYSLTPTDPCPYDITITVSNNNEIALAADSSTLKGMVAQMWLPQTNSGAAPEGSSPDIHFQENIPCFNPDSNAVEIYKSPVTYFLNEAFISTATLTGDNGPDYAGMGLCINPFSERCPKASNHQFNTRLALQFACIEQNAAGTTKCNGDPKNNLPKCNEEYSAANFSSLSFLLAYQNHNDPSWCSCVTPLDTENIFTGTPRAYKSSAHYNTVHPILCRGPAANDTSKPIICPAPTS